MLICDNWFHTVFIRQLSGGKREISEKSKKFSPKNIYVQIAYNWFLLCVLSYMWLLVCVVIYKALCFDVAQGRMNGATNENRTHSCKFASLAC